MEPGKAKPVKRLAMEKWLMTSMNYDYETIEITLSSAIDAVSHGIPQRTLSPLAGR